MKLTTITVHYGRTQSLPEYSNVKPGLTLAAELEPGDDPAAVEAALWAQARAAVQAQIDDALEACDQPARYDPAPRYQVLKSAHNAHGSRNGRYGRLPEPTETVVVILPNSHSGQIDGYTHAFYGASRKLRYAHALEKAEELAARDGRRLIDCADGDLSRLPSLVTVFEGEDER